MEKQFTIIEKHPLRNAFAVYWNFKTSFSPFFGTLRECKVAQISMNELAKKEFSKLSITEQNNVIFRKQTTIK